MPCSPVRPAARIVSMQLAECSLIALGACGGAASHSSGRLLSGSHGSCGCGSRCRGLHGGRGRLGSCLKCRGSLSRAGGHRAAGGIALSTHHASSTRLALRSGIDSGDRIAAGKGGEGAIEIFREFVSSSALSPVHARIKGHAGAIADIMRITGTGTSEQLGQDTFLPTIELHTC